MNYLLLVYVEKTLEYLRNNESDNIFIDRLKVLINQLS